MRIRFKPWAREELETSPFYIDNPQMFKNKWKTAFENDYPIYLELGCGKGNFIAQMSYLYYTFIKIYKKIHFLFYLSWLCLLLFFTKFYFLE